MEVVERVGGPFSRRNVQEWSRLDRLTGLLEHARVETDHWTASTSNSSHHFGKVVDSRSRNLADGGQEQRQQTKQLEVFQTTVPGGSLQVIRSSTTSSWQSHKTLSSGSGWPNSDRLALPSADNQDFDHLKLTLNPLDLSSQKTKASVGRSGSISSRRPPSRPRSIVGVKTDEVSEPGDSRRLTELTAICHRVHEQAKKESDRLSPVSNGYSCSQNEKIANEESSLAASDLKSLTNTEINKVIRSSSDSTVSNSHSCLFRKKSCSSEDLHTVSEERNETDSNSSEWRRSSKVRRSLQFPPKQSPTHKETIVIPVTKSVAEIKKEIEARKQLVTNSFRTNQWNNLAELEGVLGGVVSNGNHEESQSTDDSDPKEAGAISPTKAKKRQTFITVESLKEVRGRLRKLNSPVDEILKNDDVDDGIDTEVKPASPIPRTPDEFPDTPINSVKSYVYGMEVMFRNTKPPITGTGSLESKSSTKSLANGNNRSEEWYNRRKSYGFEQVSNQQSNYTSFEKSKIESSTDSGICRSSDTFPSWQKLSEKSSNQASPIKTTHSIIIKPYHDPSDNRTSDIEGGAVVQKGRKTVVNLTNNTVNTSWAWNSNSDEVKSPKEGSKEVLPRGKIADAIRSLHEKSNTENQRLSEPITISIPIQQTTKTSHTDPSSLLLKQTKNLSLVENSEKSTPHPQNGMTQYSELLFGKDAGESSGNEVKSLFENIPWRGGRTKTLSNFFDSEFKRHSIAVDQTKYLATKKSYGSYNFNGVHEANHRDTDNANAVVPYSSEKDQLKDSTDSDHESSAHEKKHKKVEFCKTEVHFAAEPGRFNIVETDGKPPPTNLYRRRRKTTSDVPVRSGLPEIRFGDTQYEKSLLSTSESTISDEASSELQTYHSNPLLLSNEKEDKITFAQSNTTGVPNRQLSTSAINQNYNTYTSDAQPNEEDDAPKPRSILKNNIPKPKPYLLGESPESHPSEESSSWGVKLKCVKSDDESTKPQTDSHLPKETEFQKLLKSLKPAASKPVDLFEVPPLTEQSSTAADNGLEVRITSSALLPDHRRASWSVADRVRHSDEARGYSTKVNFGPQETTVVDPSKSSSHFSTSEGLKSSWLIKEQNSSFGITSSHATAMFWLRSAVFTFQLVPLRHEINQQLTSNKTLPSDVKPAAQESSLKSSKRLAHSQSLSALRCQNQPEQARGVFEGNTLKSTSLVMEVQNPIANYTSEKKISVKEVSTNFTRDNCERNFNKAKEQISKNPHSVSEKIHQYSRGVMATEKERMKIYNKNTKTVPPIRKTSSSTQTYFVNRSTVRRDTNQESSSKNNFQHRNSNSPDKSFESIPGIPGVLNALDDLSRCIDEVIIEYPQKVCKKENNVDATIFKVKEDHKANKNSFQNIMSITSDRSKVKNQLDLLREIVDSGELSEDSLKADEEVRAYMSTDNDDDALSSEWSGSWSRLRTLKQNSRDAAKIDLVPRISPNFGSGLHHRQGTEAAITTSSSEAPKVTSISLRYNDSRQANISTTAVRPAAIYKASEVKHPVNSFVSRSILNTDSSSISSKVELSSSGERTWSFSKVPTTEPVMSKGESGYSNQLSLEEKEKSRLFTRDLTTSPSRFSRNSQSPTKESLFLERTTERNILYNENNRQMSSSPTSGTSGKNTSLKSIKEDYNIKKSDKVNYPSRSFITPLNKSNGQSSSLNVVKSRMEDKVENKKNDVKKSTGEIKIRERKLSTSSSGRDGWLNTPKEAPVRKKPEPSFKKQETRKENKTTEKPLKISSAKAPLKRTESPIYQNREIYAERRDSNDNTETESTILEELTKAADQILLAVNGYTDDDSFKASSDDEYRKKREKVTSQPLCTISELPTKKTNTNRQGAGVIRSTRSSDLRKEYRSSSKTRIGKTSSNSSMESGDIKPLLSAEDRSKRRAARLLQRASSRELLFTTASSSEDIGSGSDTGSLRAKRVFRRPRLQNGKHGSKQDLTASPAESKTKERVQRPSELRSNEVHKPQKVKAQPENRCSRHSKAVTGPTSSDRRERERRTQTSVSQVSRSQKKRTEASQMEVKCG